MLESILKEIDSLRSVGRSVGAGYSHARKVVQSAYARTRLLAEGEHHPILLLQITMELAEYQLPLHDLNDATQNNEALSGNSIGMLLYRLTHPKESKWMDDMWRTLPRPSD